MEMSIPLHPEKGVNPFLSYCPRCGGEGRDILLVGSNDGVYPCPACGTKIIGRPENGICPKCEQKSFGWKRERTLKEGERLPGGLCEACEKEAEEHKTIVEAGGIYWRCADCKKEGVIKPDATLAKAVREKMKIAAPKPCGCEFTKDNCPVCGPDKVD